MRELLLKIDNRINAIRSNIKELLREGDVNSYSHLNDSYNSLVALRSSYDKAESESDKKNILNAMVEISEALKFNAEIYTPRKTQARSTTGTDGLDLPLDSGLA